ncbi:unnamed protein product [Hapterophycus canaliculatus]
MFHPNVDEMSGSVCLDVINQTWSPMFDLVNIFKLFIPQLLSYPNPTDPLNGEAAALLMRDPKAYENRIRECVRLHASDPVHLDGTPVVAAPVVAAPVRRRQRQHGQRQRQLWRRGGRREQQRQQQPRRV